MNIHDVSLAKKCLCETIDETNIINCVFKNYDTNTLQQFLMYIHELLERDELLYHTLVFIFDNSKDMNKDGIIINMSPEDIEHKIIEHLTIRPEEKDKFGEVFTPSLLINEMLENLPPEVWSNPHLTWFDPANGIGDFPMIIYTKLMVSLATWQPNKVKRSNHILTKMLFMNELNPKNVKISRKLFGKSANITCSDFLTTDFLSYDIIIGNPPFQKEKSPDDNFGGSGKTLWDKFVLKSLDLLNPNGLLGFITPPAWRAPPREPYNSDTIYKIMTEQNYLRYLHIYSEKDGQTLFNVSQRFDLYIIQKNEKGNTTIIDEKNIVHNLNITQWPFIPNYELKNIEKILTSKINGIALIYNSNFYHASKNNLHVSKIEDEEYTWPIIHSITSNEIGFIYSNINQGHFGIPKVILTTTRIQYNYPEQNDYTGKYGMSQSAFGIPISSKKEGDDILKAIETDSFKEMIKATKWNSGYTDYRMFRFFKKDFYKYFLQHPVIKIQALTRGHLERKTRSKKRKGGTLKRK